MSWREAKKEASDWLRSLNLPTDLSGETIDLRALGANLTYPPAFRLMVLRAAKRELRFRGAKVK